MMISTKDWLAYINKLSLIDKTAAAKMQAYVQKHGFGDTQALIDYAYGIATKYGEGSAALAAEMYDVIAELSGKHLPPAEVAPTPEYDEVAKAVNGTAKYRNTELVSNAVGRLVKRTGVDTTMKNAIRDGAEWAWIPHGDTCAFCLTLASRGWQKASKAALKGGHAEHIHAHCDCTYAISFDGKPEYAGYDPDKYLEMYENAEGSSSKDKINALRREKYQQNKDKINAQKRAAYAKRRLLQKDKSNDNIKGAFDIGVGKPVDFDKEADFRIDIPYYSKDLNDALSTAARKVAENGGQDSYEYASIIDLSNGKEEKFDTDKEYGKVNYYYQFLRDNPNGHYAMVHNHNTESGLSLPDLQELSMWQNLDCVCAVTNNGYSSSVVTNGLKSNDYLYLEFEDVGKGVNNRLEKELKMVDAAVKKYTKGGIFNYDGRRK